MNRHLLAEIRDDAPGSLFLPSKRQTVNLAALGLAALGLALVLRYALIQNTPLGLACEAGEESLVCATRLAVVFLFMWNVFGLAAIIAASIQLWRPEVMTFRIGLVFALLGLVLYNTRLSALAITLLVLSLARPVAEER